jgi:hypothetical protein
MKHREFRDKIFDYLQGRLSGRDLQEFENHLAGCKECRKYLADAQRMDTLLRYEMPKYRQLWRPNPGFITRLKMSSQLSVSPKTTFCSWISQVGRNHRCAIGTTLSLAIAFAAILAVVLSDGLTTGPGTPSPSLHDEPFGTTGPSEPILMYIQPEDGSIVRESPIIVCGRTLPGAMVSVNGMPVFVDAVGIFRTSLDLQVGVNTIVITAKLDDIEETANVSISFTPP